MNEPGIHAGKAGRRSTYQPRPGTVAADVIALLVKRGPMRTLQLSEALGKKVEIGHLAVALREGLLVTCEVTGLGTPPQTEYRLGNGQVPAEFTPLKSRAVPHREVPAFAAPSSSAAATPQPAVGENTDSASAESGQAVPPSPASTAGCAAAARPARETGRRSAIHLAIDQDGALAIVQTDLTLKLTPEQTLALGDFLDATEVLWRP